MPAPFLSPQPPTPPQIQSQFGSGGGTFGAEGNLNVQLSAAGINPGATGIDSVLAVYALPANSFDNAGRGVSITAMGSFGATANNKRLKIVYNPTAAVVGSAVTGGTTIADTGTVTTNGGGWALQAQVFKQGSGGANTQLALHQAAQVGGALGVLLAPTQVTGTESGPILIAVTGNAATAVSDIALNFFEANATN